MALENMLTTGLWKKAFESFHGDSFEKERSKLANALLAFRSNVEPIVQRIAAILPGLTVHDVSHLDALWQTADVIAGADYPLNPLEAFVFGAVVLLHDSAMCWEAYENGINGVRETIEWKDAYAVELENTPSADESELRHRADFSTLRALHAHQAERMPEMSWTHPDTKQTLYLIEDVQLRTHLGRVIGLIAASHHWDIESVASKLSKQVNAPNSFPMEWVIDPIKIACLLRCADAAHINDARAPLFLYALLKRYGISASHWLAQARLTGPSIDSGDSSAATISFTATRPFNESEAHAWWVAYDAIHTVDYEIKQCNDLLRNRGRYQFSPEFRTKCVAGTKSIEELVKYIGVENWEPCKVEPHVSNVESLVKELGGEKLYGVGSNALFVVIRELIQNARDAIVARKYIDNEFFGEIVVRLVIRDDAKWIYVEDSGVGMSRKVMTGPLLDFGRSFWKSSLVQSEFPGLRSSKFKPIGKFGIGFYSVFMVANKVEVVSRSWDKGLDDINMLTLRDEALMRPILRHGRVVGFPSSACTRVALQLKKDCLDEHWNTSKRALSLNEQAVDVSIEQIVSALGVGIEVPIAVQGISGKKTYVHQGCVDSDLDGVSLLRRISLADAYNNKFLDDNIDKYGSRMRVIKSGERVVGFAALASTPNTQQLALSVATHGGVATGVGSGGAGNYVGYMDCLPASARRDAGKPDIPAEVLSSWAIDQISILKSVAVDPVEWCIASINAIDFGVDPTDFGVLPFVIKGELKFFSFLEAVKLASSIPLAFVTMTGMKHVDLYARLEFDSAATFLPFAHGNSLTLEMSDNQPSEELSLVGYLHKCVVAAGLKPVWQHKETGIKNILGVLMEVYELRALAL